jgi:septal ring factor EnvC (AmiA/AmiB activator)
MFRFTIREILWLTVIVALAVCWWTDRRSARRRQLDDQQRIAAQEQRLKFKDAQLVAVRTMLESANTEASAIREQLAEFVATQEDKMKIDVAPPGFYRRLAHPR